MTSQLVLSVNTSGDGKSLADHFRWCWLGGETETGSGDREALRAAVAARAIQPQSAWVILPGSQVSTRQLEYSEKEKKHLRNLLPFQLEDSVVCDIDELHFALASPQDGRIAIAYADKTWLQAAFAELAALGIEVTHCWSAPLLLPLPAPAVDRPAWALGLYGDQMYFRYAPQLGFSVAKKQGALALQLLLQAQQCVEVLPELHLYAATEADLTELNTLLPIATQTAIAQQQVMDEWALDFNSSSIDLCQGDFSQRLPIERWWKIWQPTAIFAGVCLAVYLGVLLFDIHKLNKEYTQIRQQMDASALTVVSRVRGDTEKQISIMLRDLKPASQSGSVMELLAVALPEVSAVPSVTLKGVSYAADPGDLNLNIQADSYTAFETVKKNIEAKGLKAEILGISAQGSQQSGRVKISK